MKEINHEDARDLIHRRLDNELLSFDELSAMEEHLAHCPECSGYYDKFEFATIEIAKAARVEAWRFRLLAKLKAVEALLAVVVARLHHGVSQTLEALSMPPVRRLAYAGMTLLLLCAVVFPPLLSNRRLETSLASVEAKLDQLQAGTSTIVPTARRDAEVYGTANAKFESDLLKRVVAALERGWASGNEDRYTIEEVCEFQRLTTGTMLYIGGRYREAARCFEGLFGDAHAKYRFEAGFALGTVLKHIDSSRSLGVYTNMIALLKSGSDVGIEPQKKRLYLAMMHHFAGYASHSMFRDGVAELALHGADPVAKRSVLVDAASEHLAAARHHYEAARMACAPRRYLKLEYNQAWLTMIEGRFMGLMGDMEKRNNLIAKAHSDLSGLNQFLATEISGAEGYMRYRLQWTLAQVEMLQGPTRYDAAAAALYSSVKGLPELGILLPKEHVFDPIKGRQEYVNSCAIGDDWVSEISDHLPRNLFFDEDLDPGPLEVE